MEAARTDGRRRKVSSRTRSERKLAWMLCAPAVIAMLAVTAYPIGYAFVLSLQKLDLRFPEQTEFVGLANYGTVLSSRTVVDRRLQHRR